MTVFVHIEPAHEQRPGFALWGLAQTPKLQTASATGWDVPVDLYPEVPVELLAGAYVDGYRYGVGPRQPEMLAPADPLARPKDATVELAEETRDQVVAPKPRKRAAKKTASKQPDALADQMEADLSAEGLTLDDLAQSVFQPSDGEG